MIFNARPALQKLEDELERLVRYAATDRLPVDAGVIAKAHMALREAFQLGHDEGTVWAHHENHDDAWSSGCSLCDAEREAEGLEPL